MSALIRPWTAGNGWLVLIGGSSGTWPPTEAIDRAAIERMPRNAAIAFVPAAGCPPDYGESFLATYKRLGAPDGYVAVHDGASAREPENATLLRNAGLIYFGGGDTTRLLASMANTPALDAIASAYERGAVVCGMSAGAIALAAYGVSLSAGVLEGWGWLPKTLVSVHHTPGRDEALARAHREHTETIAIALPEHTALAIGPDGEVEEWGEPGIVITPADAT